MQKINYPELFSSFIGREYDLRQVTRYHIYQKMYYRSHLFTHSKRVLWLLQSILPLVEKVFGDSFDTTKAQFLAVIHDDLEIIMGDIQAGHKNKMSAQQLEAVAEKERNAVAKISERFPHSILDYQYGELVHEEQAHISPEVKLLKYADRFDAFGEALHEIYGGNDRFGIPIIDPVYGVIDLPTEFYQKWLSNFPNLFPEFKDLFSEEHPLFAPGIFNLTKVMSQKRQPHTPDSIYLDTDYPPYNFWKNTILASGDQEEIENLYRQREF